MRTVKKPKKNFAKLSDILLFSYTDKPHVSSILYIYFSREKNAFENANKKLQI